MVTESHTQLIARAQGDIDRALACVVELVGNSDYALVDFPDHSNVGDSAIWCGEIAWLERRIGRAPSYVCALNPQWPILDAVAERGVILIHGGGNFGDLWPRHQMFRHELLRRYRGRPIMQLPQSIHFSAEDLLTETKAAIAAHGAFTLCVRDDWSLEFAEQNLECRVVKSPDMAFCLGPIDRPNRPSLERLALLRTDKEVRERTLPLSKDIKVADWLDDEPGLYRRARFRGLRRAAQNALYSGLSRRQREYHRLNALAEMRVQRGLRLLSQAKYIVTNRLHAHILSTLLGIPHTVLDNSYGKIGRYMQAHKTQWSGAKVWEED